MTDAEVLEKVTELMQEVLDDDSVELRPETTAEDVDGWDSVVQIQLLVAVESEFGVKFETEEISSMASVGTLVQMIQSKLG